MVTPRVDTFKRFFETPANVARAKALLREGKNDRMVAELLGVSRSSVTKMRNRERTRASNDHLRVRSRDTRSPVLPQDHRSLRGPAWRRLPGSSPVALIDLEPGMCKWPIGEEAPYLFCGEACEGVYCEHHQALSHGTGTKGERSAHRVSVGVRQ